MLVFTGMPNMFFGFDSSETAEVMDMTRRILHLSEVPKPDDAADALALAICHGHCAKPDY